MSSTGFAAGFGLTAGAGEVGAAGVAEMAGEVGSPGPATDGGARGFDPIVGAVGGWTGIERPMADRAVKAGSGTKGGVLGDAAAASIADGAAALADAPGAALAEAAGASLAAGAVLGAPRSTEAVADTVGDGSGAWAADAVPTGSAGAPPPRSLSRKVAPATAAAVTTPRSRSVPALPFFGGGLDVTLNGLGRTDGRTDDGRPCSCAPPLATGDSRAVRGGIRRHLRRR